MNILFALSLIASVIVLMVCPVMHLLVGRCRAFGFNRFGILGSMSVILLLTSIVYSHRYLPVVQDAGTVNIALNAVTSAVNQSSTGEEFILRTEAGAGLMSWMILAYGIGIVTLMIRQTVSYLRVFRIIRNSVKLKDGGVIVCRHSENSLSPFSWGKYIVMPEDEEDSAILIHEKAHTLKRHWIDVMVADAFCIFLWYNPFSWLMRSLMRQNHEFEADDAVVRSGVDVLSYQRLLIAKAAGRRVIPAVNNFSTGGRNFRRRVLIMNETKYSGGTKWLLTLSLPAFALAVAAGTTASSIEMINLISSCKSPSYFRQSSSVTAVSEETVDSPYDGMEIRGVVEIEKLLPSPITDPEPLRHCFKVSFEAADKELLPEKLLVRIEVDEKGNIINVSSNNDNKPEVRVAIDKALNGVHFEVVKDNGRSVKTSYVLPINLSGF